MCSQPHRSLLRTIANCAAGGGMQISLLMDTHSIERSLTWIRKTTVVVSLSQIEWQLGKNKVLSEKSLSTLGPLILKRNNERKKGAHPSFTKKQLGCPRLHKSLFLLQKY